MASVIRGSDNFDSASNSSAESGGGISVLTETPSGTVTVSGVPPQYTGWSLEMARTAQSRKALATARLGNKIYYTEKTYGGGRMFIRITDINSENANTTLSITETSEIIILNNDDINDTHLYSRYVADLATDSTHFWVMTTRGKIVRLDPSTNRKDPSTNLIDVDTLIAGQVFTRLALSSGQGYQQSIAADGTHLYIKFSAVLTSDNTVPYGVIVLKVTYAGAIVQNDGDPVLFKVSDSDTNNVSSTASNGVRISALRTQFNSSTGTGNYHSGYLTFHNNRLWDKGHNYPARVITYDKSTGAKLTFVIPSTGYNYNDSCGDTLKDIHGGIFFDANDGQMRVMGAGANMRCYTFSMSASSITVAANKIGLLAEAGDSVVVFGSTTVTVAAVTNDNLITTSSSVAAATADNSVVKRVNAVTDIATTVKVSPLTLALRTPS